MNESELQNLERLEQQLRRKELSLARAKGKKGKMQLADTRLKIRLGHLLRLCGWHQHQRDDIESRLAKTTDRLKRLTQAELEKLKSDGNKLLLTIEHSSSDARPTEPMSGTDRIDLRDKMIELGTIMMEYQLHHQHRSVLFAVLQNIDSE